MCPSWLKLNGQIFVVAAGTPATTPATRREWLRPRSTRSVSDIKLPAGEYVFRYMAYGAGSYRVRIYDVAANRTLAISPNTDSPHGHRNLSFQVP